MNGLAIAMMLAGSVFGWEQMPSLPRAISGQCAGVSNGALLVIGGSYFPVPLFQGGKKTWVDTIYVVTPEATEWKTFRAPRPIGYAACATDQDGVVVAGGGDAEKSFHEVFRVAWVDRRVVTTELPALPQPLANAAATMAGRVMYVAGGQGAPTATESSRALYALDLQRPAAGWKRLDDCPGPGRILPVLGTVAGALYLAGGAQLHAGPDGVAKRTYLRDAWQYRIGGKWTPLADMPRPVVAPAVLSRGSSIYIFGGDDGANAARAQELKDAHPGFGREVVAWNPEQGKWSRAADYPAGLVTTMAVEWSGKAVVAGGEDRPGHRSAAVVALPLEKLP